MDMSKKPVVDKVDFRVFLSRPVVEIIDGMIRKGNYSSRSEAVRDLVDAHLRDCLGLLKLRVSKSKFG